MNYDATKAIKNQLKIVITIYQLVSFITASSIQNKVHFF